MILIGTVLEVLKAVNNSLVSGHLEKKVLRERVRLRECLLNTEFDWEVKTGIQLRKVSVSAYESVRLIAEVDCVSRQANRTRGLTVSPFH